MSTEDVHLSGPLRMTPPEETSEGVGVDQTETGEESGADFLTATFTRRIVVPTDFSLTAGLALTLAIRFAKLLRAAIDIIHVFPLPAYAAPSALPGAFVLPPTPEILDGLDEKMAQLAAKVRQSGVECQTATMEGKASDEIIAHAAKIGADLIVMGTQGRSGVRRMLLGSVAEQVLHKARCPVLIAPAASDAEPAPEA